MSYRNSYRNINNDSIGTNLLIVLAVLLVANLVVSIINLYKQNNNKQKDSYVGTFKKVNNGSISSRSSGSSMGGTQ